MIMFSLGEAITWLTDNWQWIVIVIAIIFTFRAVWRVIKFGGTFWEGIKTFFGWIFSFKTIIKFLVTVAITLLIVFVVRELF